MDEDFRAQITREDIQEAIAALAQGEDHAFGPSTSYDVLEGDRRYPPKAVVGLAARRVLGRVLRHDEFSGGEASWAFRLLRDRGFNVVKKLRRDDTSELPKTAPAQVWIEDTNTAAHGHGGPGWEFGSCLWSPSSYEGGSDHYSIMREPKAGDYVIHFDDGIIVGWSRVAEEFQESTEAPPNSAQWAARPSYYRINLMEYQDFPHKVPLSEFIIHHHDALIEELRTDTPKRFPFIIYNDSIRRAQGAYLTRCTPKLYDLIRNEVYLDDEPENFDRISRTWRRHPRVEERIRTKLQLITQNDDVRRGALEVLGWAIEAADEDRADAWYLRETEHGLRLIAGWLNTCELRRSSLRVSVIGPITSEVLGTLGAEIEDELKWIPGGIVLRIPLDKTGAALSLLKDAMDAFIDGGMSRVRRAVSLADHTPEAINYLSTVLGRDLPQPEPGSELPDDDAAGEEEEVGSSREPKVRGRAPIFEYGQRSITSLISDIERGVIALPDLQRPFVWEDTKVRDLLDSLFVGFPVGTLVFWHTADDKDARALGTNRLGLRATTLVIDGQQRLTSLYAVMKGEKVVGKDGEKRKISIAFRPRDGRFAVADAAIRRDPEYLPDVTEIWNWKGTRTKPQIRRELMSGLRERGRLVDDQYEDAVERNIDRADSIADYRFPTVDIRRTAAGEVTEEDVAEIFVRINSQGARLGQADFVLTLLSVYHGALREKLEERAQAMSIGAVVGLDTQQLLRAVCGVAFGRARMSAVYRFLRGVDPVTGEADPERRVARLNELDNAANDCIEPTPWRDYLLCVKHAGFVNESLVASKNAIVNAYAFYIRGRKAAVPKPKLDTVISRWIFSSLLTARYSGSSETFFEEDLARLARLDKNDPDAFVRELDAAMAETLTGDYWTQTLVSALETQRARAPAALTFRAAQIILGARALFSDHLLQNLLDQAQPAGRAAREAHHLFPTTRVGPR